MPDEDVAGFENRNDGVEPALHRGFLMGSRTVARYVDRDRVMAQCLEFRHRAAPAPRAMEPTVYEHEPHWAPSSVGIVHPGRAPYAVPGSHRGANVVRRFAMEQMRVGGSLVARDCV